MFYRKQFNCEKAGHDYGGKSDMHIEDKVKDSQFYFSLRIREQRGSLYSVQYLFKSRFKAWRQSRWRP